MNEAESTKLRPGGGSVGLGPPSNDMSRKRFEDKRLNKDKSLIWNSVSRAIRQLCALSDHFPSFPSVEATQLSASEEWLKGGTYREPHENWVQRRV